MRLMLCLMFVVLSACGEQALEPPVSLPAAEIGSPSEDSQVLAIHFEGRFRNKGLDVGGHSLFEAVPVRPQVDQQQRAEAVFDFVSRNFFVWNVRLDMETTTYTYGLGYGLCGIESLVMSSLWNRQGLRARVVSWERHTMAEAEVDGNWYLFDGQHRVNFSDVAGRPIDFESIKQDSSIIPDGLDPIGYDAPYNRALFAAADHKVTLFELKKTGNRPPGEPRFSMADNQSLTVRRRSTVAEFPVPILSPPDTRHRTHVIPLYEVVFTHRSTGESATLHTGLPILGVSFNRGVLADAAYGGLFNGKRFKKQESSQLSRALSGNIQPVTFMLPEGEMLTVTYAMAGWAGRRLFGDYKQAALSGGEGRGRIVAERGDHPRLMIVDITGYEGLGDEQHLTVTLAWSGLRSEKQLDYRIFLDELSSGLPLEARAHIKEWKWCWNPVQDGEQGRHTFTTPWKPPVKGGPYRPSNIRSVFAHIKGPYVDTGQGTLLKHYRF